MVREFHDDGSEAMKVYAKYRKPKLPSAGTVFNNDEQSKMVLICFESKSEHADTRSVYRSALLRKH